MNPQPGELFRLLSANGACKTGEPDSRLLRWAEALDAWLADRYTRFSPNVGPDSYRAWAEFLAFTNKPPWAIQVEDVEAYIEELQGRGLSAGTIQKRMTGLKSFYTYCQEKDIDQQDKVGSRSSRCGINFNPAAQVKRPRVKGYEKANYLSLEEEEALLTVIRSDPSVIGKRDYALFLMLLRTGCRAVQARVLRWGHIPGQGSLDTGEDGGEGDGRDQVELPEEVLAAVVDYLEAAGRLDSIRVEEYVFAPSKAALVKEAGNNAEDWAVDRPLSRDQLHYLVKLYARWAGLEAEKITCHTLHHTATMRRVERGEDDIGVQKKSGRIWSSKTVQKLKKIEHIPLRTRKRDLKNFRPPSRGPERFKLRNHMGLKHGLRAKYLPEMEWLDEQGYDLSIFEREHFRLKTVWQRAMILYKEAETTREQRVLLEAALEARFQLGRLKMAILDWLEAERKLMEE